jgi:RNA polymerase sigma factor for flagellar operon FliA
LSAAAAAAFDPNELAEAHLHLIEPIARRLAATLPASFALEDLIGAGRVGLVEAARRYRPQDHGGAPFSAWARVKIRGAMLDSIRRAAWLEAKRPALEDSREPAALTITEAAVDREFLGLRVAAAIKSLPELQRRVLLLYYDEGLRLRAIGQTIGKGRSRASKLHMEAIRSLRRRLSS